MSKPRHSDYSQDVLDGNPELVEALAAGKSVRVKSTKAIAVVNQAPSFNYAWKMTGPHLFPDPDSEYKFHKDRQWKFDFCFPRYMLAVEIDGGQWKPGGGRHSSDEDRDKCNHGAIMGFRIMHFSPERIQNDPAGCVGLVLDALLSWKI